jgi:hypothetical protein
LDANLTNKPYAACGKLRFDRAKEAVAAHRSQASNVSSIDKDWVRKKLDAMRSGADENVGGMMMAARKGRKLSDSDTATRKVRWTI